MIEITVTPAPAERGIERTRAEILARARRGTTIAAERLATYVKDEKLDGQVLKRRTRKLVRSVHAIPAEDRGDGAVESYVVAGGGVAWYGRVHEYGGSRAYEIVPVHRRFLRFIGRDGATVFTRHVSHPPLPQRSFMASSAEDRKGDVAEQIRLALAEGGAE